MRSAGHTESALVPRHGPFLAKAGILAGLLAIFILALIVTMLELQKRKEELLREQAALVEALQRKRLSDAAALDKFGRALADYGFIPDTLGGDGDRC